MNLILLDYTEALPSSNDDESSPGHTSSSAVTQQQDQKRFALASSDARAKHIIKHLKKIKGDNLRIGLFPNGPCGQAQITNLTNDGTIHLQVIQTWPLRPRPLVRLILGTPYPKVVKALFPVLVSLSVDAILYARADLTEPAFMETTSLMPEVYEPWIRQGLAQAQDTRPPVVTLWSKTKTILDFLQSTDLNALTADCCKIVLHIDDDNNDTTTPRQSIRQCFLQQPAQGIVLAIGPERGWTDAEAAAFGTAGFALASLGNEILRTDTAAIAAIALARDVLQETGEETNGKTAKRARLEG